MSETALPTQSLQVFPAAMLRVANGANEGDTLSFAAELALDDIYTLPNATKPKRLSVEMSEGESMIVTPESAVGTPGAEVYLDSCITLMTPTGATVEVIVLVETDSAMDVSAIYALPLAPLSAGTDYTLVGIDTDAARTRFAQLVCVSFTRGTHITLATGAQCPIEDLRIGDRVLTRDDGVQTIRWLGQTTVRAEGALCPIVITKGTLNSNEDLIVSPDQRLFVYQRQDAVGAGRSELMVKARHLVNGGSVYPQAGGYVDYFQILFDSHQIIYAEGIAVESMLVDRRTSPVIPLDVLGKVKAGMRGNARMHQDFEIGDRFLGDRDAVGVLRLASSR